jgi:hypothetical protein
VITRPDGQTGDQVTPPDVPADQATEDVAPDGGEMDAGEDVIIEDVAPDGKVMPDAEMDVAAVDAADVPMVMDVPALMDVPSTMDVPAPMDAVTADAAPEAGVDAAPEAGLCALATVRALRLPSDMAMGTTSGMSRVPGASCAGPTMTAGGPEHIYTLPVYTRTGVMLNVTSATFDTTVSIRRACADAMSEVACDDDSGAGTLSLIRAVLDPGDYYVIVDQYGTSGTGGDYTLAVSAFTPAANRECSAASALMPGASVTGNLIAGGEPNATCLTDADGPQLFYSLSIPAGQRLTITATPTGMPAWVPVVRVLSGCAATTCLASAQAPTAGSPASAMLDNRGTTTQNVIISVSSIDPDVFGTFSLVANLTPLPMTPPHAMCSMARMVTSGTRLMGEDVSLATTRPSCAGTSGGFGLFYTATIPAGHTLAVVATPTGMTAWDPTIRLQADCAATTCLSTGSASGTGTPERFAYTNTGTTAQTVIFAVAPSTSTGATGTFDLAVDIVAPMPANAMCAMATPVMDGTTLTAQNTGSGSAPPTGTNCGTSTGNVLYYSATVPAQSTLTVTASPYGFPTPAVRVLDACGATTCLASGTGNTFVYTNETMMDRPVILAIGRTTTTTPAVFDLNFAIAPLPYVKTTIPATCDDMTGAMAVGGLTTDDSISMITMLPFAFDYFGATATHYQVSTNGFLSLQPSAMSPLTSSYYSNDTIPNTALPNGVIGPLWDDLDEPSGITPSVLIRTIGMAPNRRFVVQWTNWAFFSGTSARLTFQAKLFESTNVIEFHYCMLTAGSTGTRATGSSATVGIESMDGMRGYQHSYNTADAINTSSAIRFTPRP